MPMDIIISMSQLKVSQQGQILSSALKGGIRKRLTELGFVENKQVTCVGTSPSGDPRAYLISGAVIALRNCDSIKIYVKRYGKCL